MMTLICGSISLALTTLFAVMSFNAVRLNYNIIRKYDIDTPKPKAVWDAIKNEDVMIPVFVINFTLTLCYVISITK